MTATTDSEAVRVVGIDCATQATQVGVAFGTVDAGRLTVDRACAHKTWDAIDEEVVAYLQDGPALLALDAPLGWPALMGDKLHQHRAGEKWRWPRSRSRRRRTDEVVCGALGKRPLDVGAERIARTAHTSLAFLGRLRARTGYRIPLAWTPGRLTEPVAIEVYPAATLAGRGLKSSGYKGTKTFAWEARQSILDSLGSVAPIESIGDELRESAIGSDHMLDAMLCLLAACDFVVGEVIFPEDERLAAREGWIWVRPPAGPSAPSTV